MANERFNPNMTDEEIILAMAGSNPGAIIACAQLIGCAKRASDPRQAGYVFDAFCLLDRLNILDERIGMLWGDVCGHNVSKMIAVLLACRLELAGVNKRTINHAIYNRGAGIDLDAVVSAVQEHLPSLKLFMNVLMADTNMPRQSIFARTNKIWSAIGRWLTAR